MSGPVSSRITFAQLKPSVLITYRIWSIDRKVNTRADGSSLRPVIAIVVESGALAAITSMTTLITYLAGSNAQYICLDAVCFFI